MPLEVDGLLPLGNLRNLITQADSPFPFWLPKFCFHHIPAPQPCCVCQHRQKTAILRHPQGASQGADAADFQLLHCSPCTFSSHPFGQRFILGIALLRTHVLLNLSFLLTPTQTQTVSLPLLPIAKAFPMLCAPFHTPWPYPVSAAGSHRPALSAAGLQSQYRLLNTSSSHHCPPSITTIINQLWMTFRMLLSPVCTTCQAGVSPCDVMEQTCSPACFL